MKEELKRIDRVLTNYDNLNLKLDEYLKILENDNEMYSQLKDEYENILNDLKEYILTHKIYDEVKFKSELLKIIGGVE